jgi:hypothetical protein
MVRAAALLSSTDKVKRLEAAKLAGRQWQGQHQDHAAGAPADQETDAEVKAALGSALRQVESASGLG